MKIGFGSASLGFAEEVSAPDIILGDEGGDNERGCKIAKSSIIGSIVFVFIKMFKSALFQRTTYQK